MARRKPDYTDAFGRINGVGATKLAKYAVRFSGGHYPAQFPTCTGAPRTGGAPPGTVYDRSANPKQVNARAQRARQKPVSCSASLRAQGRRKTPDVTFGGWKHCRSPPCRAVWPRSLGRVHADSDKWLEGGRAAHLILGMIRTGKVRQNARCTRPRPKRLDLDRRGPPYTATIPDFQKDVKPSLTKGARKDSVVGDLRRLRHLSDDLARLNTTVPQKLARASDPRQKPASARLRRGHAIRDWKPRLCRG